MDPFEIIAGSITILEALIAAYNVIKRIKNIPKAFEEVGENLDFVKETLQLADQRLGETEVFRNQSARKVVADKVGQCKDRLESLEKIFGDIKGQLDKTDNGGGQEQMAWSTRIKRVYKQCVIGMGGKDARVEKLMKKVLEDLRDLATFQAFAPVGAQQLSKLETLLARLDEIEPSIDESEFEEKVAFSQESGIQSYTSGGTTTNSMQSFRDHGISVSGEGSTVTIGETKTAGYS